jgi:4-phytase / acid phosphatase
MGRGLSCIFQPRLRFWREFLNLRIAGICISAIFILFARTPRASAQATSSEARNAASSAAPNQARLKFVVIVSRHGVRSPTGKLDSLNRYAHEPWPAWSVKPGYLTAHGFDLMRLFGAYDRQLLASEGLLSVQGCGDAGLIRIRADSDQRTRETGKALAEGLAPGCGVSVTALPEGVPDPLFHPVEAGLGKPDGAQAAAAVMGRIGADPAALVEVYRPQLEKLDAVLHGCDGAGCGGKNGSDPLSIFSAPSSVTPGNSDHLIEFRSPLSVASTMTENFLLEYADGMDAKDVGWGRVDAATLRELMQLHVANEDIALRTPCIARAQASNLLFHALASMEQAESGRAVAGALTKPNDKLLILVGHDTNQAVVAGALGLNWLVDGRRDDTPPGGALVFELWQRSGTKDGEFVRVYYTAQTLDQMRNLTPLSLSSPPVRVPVFIPGCSLADFSCEWRDFVKASQAAIDPAFTARTF